MPEPKLFPLLDFLDFGKAVESAARITGIQRMISIDQPGFSRTTMSKERRIAISWGKYLPPDDVPKGREARVCWDGVIESPEGGSSNSSPRDTRKSDSGRANSAIRRVMS